MRRSTQNIIYTSHITFWRTNNKYTQNKRTTTTNMWFGFTKYGMTYGKHLIYHIVYSCIIIRISDIFYLFLQKLTYILFIIILITYDYNYPENTILTCFNLQLQFTITIR